MMSIVWPRSVIRGSTTVMWIDASAPAENVTLRLAADDRLYQDKSIPFLHQGNGRPFLSSLSFYMDCLYVVLMVMMAAGEKRRRVSRGASRPSYTPLPAGSLFSNVELSFKVSLPWSWPFRSSLRVNSRFVWDARIAPRRPFCPFIPWIPSNH